MGTLRSWKRIGAGLAVVALAAGTTAGVLALSSGGSSPATVSGTLIQVTEHDFHIATSLSSVQAGAVTLRIHNNGPDQHELILLPLHGAEAPTALPLRTDGFTVDEDLLQNQEPGSINPQRSGGTEYLHVQLQPGRYVLFCNMAGHFMAGMHTELTVTA